MKKPERLATMLSAIRRLTKEHGYPPSFREIADSEGVSLTYTHTCLSQLREQGKVDFDSTRARTLRVLN